MLGGYIFLAAVALTTGLATLWWPAKTAGVLLLFAPIIWGGGAADIHSQGPTPPNIAVAVSGVATLMYGRFLLRPQKIRPLKWLRTASIVYCLTILPSIFIGAFSFQSFSGYVRLVSPVVFMFALLDGSCTRGVNAFHFKTFTLATVSLLGVIIAAQYMGEGSFAMGGFDRLRAFNLPPHNISLYSVAASGALVCGILLGTHRFVYAMGIVALVICTYLTGFRTAWVGMAVMMSVVMITAVRSRSVKFIALLVTLALLGQTSTIVRSLERYAREDEAMSVDTADEITSGRITEDSAALNGFLASGPTAWLFGIGVYSSQQLTLQETGTGFGVHSDPLATFIECGAVGLLGYLFLLVTIGCVLLRVRRCLPQQHAARTFVSVGFALFVAFTTMGISGALYTNVFVGWYYYGFLGFALGQLRASKSVFRQLLSTECQSRSHTTYGKATSCA